MQGKYDNTNRGALFKNQRRETPQHPEYNGSINVAGVDYWVSAWVKSANNGQKFFSLSVKPKAPAQPKAEAVTPADFDDDLPF